jgi:hypothetical protein
MPQRHTIRRLAPAAIAVALCGTALSIGPRAGAAEQADFTGVWGVYREPGQQRAGRFGDPEDLPLRPDARRRIEEYEALVAPGGDTPGGFCLGTGMPGSMLGSGGYPMEIVQHDDVLIVVYEAHSEVRHIYTSGKRVAEEDLFPDRNGYSVGRWDGDKLIVETTHLKEAVDQRRYPHSDQARILEEYELTTDDDGAKVLVASLTMTDPVFYTEPVTAVKKWAFLPDTRLLPYECNEPAWEEHLEQLREGGNQESP